MVKSVLQWGALALLFLVSATALSAQDSDEVGPLGFTFSYSSFAVDQDFVPLDGVTQMEFGFQFSEQGLHYRGGKGGLVIMMTLFDTAGESVATHLWTIDHSLSGEKPEPYLLTTLKRTELVPGTYVAELRISDRNRYDVVDTARFDLFVPKYSIEEFGVSDIELIGELAPTTDSAHPFRRGGYLLTRLVDGVIVPQSRRLNAYVEIYNTDRLPSTMQTLTWRIADTSGQGLYRLDTLLPRREGAVSFETLSLAIDGLTSGMYIIAAKLHNGPLGLATDSIEVFRTFEVWNPRLDSMETLKEEILATAIDEIDPLYAGMREEELDLEFEKASVIITPWKQSIYAELDGAEPKARFLSRFWHGLDDDPSTPENPFREDYDMRAAKASKLYRSAMSPNGWDSDRGRILLQYGNPDGVEYHVADYNRKPYEIWSYSSSRYQFVFVDHAQTGTYKLVHSTAPNQPRAPNWERDHAMMDDNPNDLDRSDDPFRSFND